MRYALPLDMGPAEVIFAPLHDPEHSAAIPVDIDRDAINEVTRTALWDSTLFSWRAGLAKPFTFTLKVVAPFSTSHHDQLVLCHSLPRGAVVEVSPLTEDYQPLTRWTPGIRGEGRRQEIILPIATFFERRFRWPRRPQPTEFGGLALRVTVLDDDPGLFSISWLGLRNGALHQQLAASRRAARPDWTPWLRPEAEWPDVQFERGLLFDAADLAAVRSRILLPGWREHFSLLEGRAAEYLARDPEADFGDYLPNHDARYQRVGENGRRAYHWEALVVAFVGLVRQDRTLLQHALRYLMCMVHSRYWTESAEHRIPSSTWTHRCFMEEMTTTSVALLFDWLSFALEPRAKALIRQALWERGMTAVKRDLLQWDYVHEMNQGAVFSRALILGGLMLEPAWPRLGRYVDEAYETMTAVLDRYVRADGGVHEGIGYLCQMLTGVLWALIAYRRARGGDWREEAARRFAAVGRYVAAMSAMEPGKAIPAGDCRVEWFSGDALPILATVFPDSPMAGILGNCLVGGWVHELTGTLAKSGGLIGLVHGPDRVPPSRSVVGEFDFLPQSAKVSLLRGGKDGLPRWRLWISGGVAGGTHAHHDLGQFCLELAGEPVFVDRGMVQYWHAEAHFLSRSWMHNVLTPVDEDGSYPCQVPPAGDFAIQVSSDGSRIIVPGNNIWGYRMARYQREFHLAGEDGFRIADDFELVADRRVAFHLQSPHRFTVEGNRAWLQRPDGRLDVAFPWAAEVRCEAALVDLCHRPVYHLCATSELLRKGEAHRLETIIGVRG